MIQDSSEPPQNLRRHIWLNLSYAILCHLTLRKPSKTCQRLSQIHQKSTLQHSKSIQNRPWKPSWVDSAPKLGNEAIWGQLRRPYAIKSQEKPARNYLKYIKNHPQSIPNPSKIVPGSLPGPTRHRKLWMRLSEASPATNLGFPWGSQIQQKSIQCCQNRSKIY